MPIIFRKDSDTAISAEPVAGIEDAGKLEDAAKRLVRDHRPKLLMCDGCECLNVGSNLHRGPNAYQPRRLGFCSSRALDTTKHDAPT